ncbi:MAG TPA: MGMT family protein [Candidatus Nanoarchaeia archaeon]|nr:MGMT family protein [Candidatus Nanoarchaeia archaeon]
MKKSFNEQCYEILRKVPKGKVTTYKAIAEKLNSKAYRQVGRAMNKNPCGFLSGGNVPCHRVVGSNGKLVGFAHGLKKKEEMLKEEGVSIINGKVDLDKYKFEL